MFELAESGIYSDEVIVGIVNKMGYKSRVYRSRDKRTGKSIEAKGANPLSVKQLRRYLENFNYCSIKAEKWSHYLPVRIPVPPPITIGTFNKVNKKKIQIIEENGNIKILKMNGKRLINKNNPAFPYKGHVLCEKCLRPYKASFPTNKKHIPYGFYHCSNKHAWTSVPKKKMEATIEKFANRISLKDSFFELFKEITLDLWEKKREEVTEVSIQQGQRSVDIQKQIKLQMEKIKILESPVVIREIEKDIEKLEFEKAQAEDFRNDAEIENYDLKELLNRTKNFMEHPAEWILNTDDSLEKGLLFSLLFDKKPTYQELKDGTPLLSPIFDIATRVTKNEVVDARLMVTPTLSISNTMIDDFVVFVKDLMTLFPLQKSFMYRL